MSDRLRATLTRLLPLLTVVLFAVAVIVLRRELAGARYAQIVGHLHGRSRRALATALGITLLGYGVLTRYDALGMRYVHRRIRASRIALASFIAHSLSQTLGFVIFTGGGVRYRFWSSWGLSAAEIGRAIGFAGLTLWIGVVTLSGGPRGGGPDTPGGRPPAGPLRAAPAGTGPHLPRVRRRVRAGAGRGSGEPPAGWPRCVRHADRPAAPPF